MLELKLKNQFKKDLRLMQKRGKSATKLWRVVELLQNEKELDFKHKNHQLKGDKKGVWDCHIEPDWLLLYLLTPSDIILLRTGTHSDLF